MRLFGIAACTVLIAIGASAALARESLTAPNECPAAGPHRACLMTYIVERHPDSKRIINRAADGILVTTRLDLKGRLSTDAARTSYRVTLVQDTAEGYDTAAAERVLVPYLGRSRHNHPVILTNRGPLEVLTRAVTIGADPFVILVDAKRQRVFARYSDARDTHIVQSARGIKVWARQSDACVSAPSERPELLIADERACDPAFALESSDRFAPASHVTLERLLKLVPDLENLQLVSSGPGDFGGGGWTVMVYTVRNQPFLIIYESCNDCE